jgi:ADP-ribosylation factor-binding protein GGA
MLDNLKQGDTIDEAGTMEELKNACESALPKIKNMLKEEEDAEKIELLNEVKSIIKGVVLKYQDIKHGHYDTEYDISGKFKSEEAADLPPQAISLIDLDDMIGTNDSSTASSPNSNANSSSKNALDELSDIFGEKSSISNTSTPASNADPFDLLSQSIRLNTLPPSSPNLAKATTTASSSPIVISSPHQDNQDKAERTSKYKYMKWIV